MKTNNMEKEQKKEGRRNALKRMARIGLGAVSIAFISQSELISPIDSYDRYSSCYSSYCSSSGYSSSCYSSYASSCHSSYSSSG